MNVRRNIAAVGAAGALATGSLFLASPAQAAPPVITGGLVNVTVVDAVDVNNNRILQNVGVGVAANVQAQVCAASRSALRS